MILPTPPQKERYNPFSHFYHNSKTRIIITTVRVAPNTPFWVVYAHTPLHLPVTLAACPHTASLRPPSWTIPKEDKLQMYEHPPYPRPEGRT